MPNALCPIMFWFDVLLISIFKPWKMRNLYTSQ